LCRREILGFQELGGTAREQVAGTEEIQKCRFLRAPSRLLCLFHNYVSNISVKTTFVKTPVAFEHTAKRGSNRGRHDVGREVPLAARACFLLATDLTLTAVGAQTIFLFSLTGRIASCNGGGDCLLVGGNFVRTGKHAGMLWRELPPIVHTRKESEKMAMRCSLERLRGSCTIRSRAVFWSHMHSKCWNSQAAETLTV